MALVGLHAGRLHAQPPRVPLGDLRAQAEYSGVPRQHLSYRQLQQQSERTTRSTRRTLSFRRSIRPPFASVDARPGSQKLSPVTDAVLENETGGENVMENGQLLGPGNIQAVNKSGQTFLKGQKAPEPTSLTTN